MSLGVNRLMSIIVVSIEEQEHKEESHAEEHEYVVSFVSESVPIAKLLCRIA